ncbi:uncharacterized protein LOC144341351 [Macaca mulatta]
MPGTRPPYGNAGRGVGGGAEGRGGEDGGEGGVGGGSGTARSAAGLGQSTRTRGGSGSGSDATHPLPQHPPSQRTTEPRALGPAPRFLPSWIWGAAFPGAGRSSEYRGGPQAAARRRHEASSACRGPAPALLTSPASRCPQSPAAGRSEGQSGALLQLIDCVPRMLNLLIS